MLLKILLQPKLRLSLSGIQRQSLWAILIGLGQSIRIDHTSPPRICLPKCTISPNATGGMPCCAMRLSVRRKSYRCVESSSRNYVNSGLICSLLQRNPAHWAPIIAKHLFLSPFPRAFLGFMNWAFPSAKFLHPASFRQCHCECHPGCFLAAQVCVHGPQFFCYKTINAFKPFHIFFDDTLMPGNILLDGFDF